MLIVRGVNVFPSAVRAVVAELAPEVSGVVAIRPAAKGARQIPPLPVAVEATAEARGDLAERLQRRLRERLAVTTAVTLVPMGSLPRSDYKSKLVDWSAATA
jgi:phenylacetate-CoA ligase